MSQHRTLLRSVVVLVSLVAGPVGLGPASSPAHAAEPGRITGTVTGPGGVPLAGATVSAYPVDCPNGCDSFSAVAGSDGGYAVEGVDPGSYLLLIQDGFDHIAEYYDNVTDDDAATHVKVAAGATVTGIDAQLETGGHLTGVVRGRGGKPVRGISVLAYSRVKGRWQSSEQTTTARDGSYDIGKGGLLGGAYRLRFTDDREPGYLMQFYWGASTVRGGTTIVMEENETVTGLDVRLGWPRALRSVTAPTVVGKPRAGGLVRLLPGRWKPAKVSVEVLGWYAGDLTHYLGTRKRKLRIAGRALAESRGKLLLVRFTVRAEGYISVTRTLTVPGGVVT